MIKLLWIDDNLDHDLTEKRMALLMDEDIDPHFARDATEAYYRLQDETFDVILFDLRLPSGPDDMWNDHRKRGIQKFGPVLLKLICEDIENKFKHLRQARKGVFTIETKEENSELFIHPISLPDENFLMKTNAYNEDDFLDFIRKIFEV